MLLNSLTQVTWLQNNTSNSVQVYKSELIHLDAFFSWDKEMFNENRAVTAPLPDFFFFP